jgi:hypothetical protein
MKRFLLMWMLLSALGLLLFIGVHNSAAADRLLMLPASDELRPMDSAADRSNARATVTLQLTDTITYYLYLPLTIRSEDIDPCAPTDETYGTLPPIDPMPTGVAATQPDINLEMRGYSPTMADLELIDYTGNVDPNAPQLYTLFTDERTATFQSAYRVNRWDWTCNCRGGPIQKWDVTLLGLATTPGEKIRLPVAGYDIGGGYSALVLYAEANRLTLKYTRDDNVVTGYTIHLENLCVDPNLLALYQDMEAAGRNELPALYPGQPLGRALSDEVDVAIRDGGSFLDPRSRKDWWQGR